LLLLQTHEQWIGTKQQETAPLWKLVGFLDTKSLEDGILSFDSIFDFAIHHQVGAIAAFSL
jgi:hypothetical protein